jgi:hypothetical protein
VVHKSKNWSHKEPENVSNGDTIEQCNLSQILPNTSICSGITGLTFRNCNLTNCSIPEDAIVEDCNITQIDRCYHLHSELDLAVEVDSCRHVTEVEEVYVDSVLVETIYTREDIVL